MGLLKKIYNLITGKQDDAEQSSEQILLEQTRDFDEVVDVDVDVTVMSEVKVESEDKVLEGVVETVPVKKSAVAPVKMVDFDKIVTEKFKSKKSRLTDKRIGLVSNISKAEESKESTTDQYLKGLATKDIKAKQDQLDDVDKLLGVTVEEFAEVMSHKSNLTYLNLIQKTLTRLKKQEKKALSQCSEQARALAKGCRSILPFDTQNTVEEIEGTVSITNGEEV